MTKEDIKTEVKEEFEKLKSELDIKSSFEEIDKIFFIIDDVIGAGVVSNRFDRQLCSRIVDTIYSWYNKLHSIMMPNPGSIVNMTESQMFTDEEKLRLNLTMNKMLAHVTKNSILGVNKDIKGQGEFIDSSVDIWNNLIQEELRFLMVRIQEKWEEYSVEVERKPERNSSY